MQRKGISFWEAHLEHIVLGAAALFFVAFTVLQFTSAPNSVELGSHGTVSPGEIDGILREKATTIQTRLAPEAGAEIDIPRRQPVADAFASALTGSVSPDGPLAVTERRVVIDKDVEVKRDQEYATLTIPAPRKIVTEQSFVALADHVPDDHPQLQERFTVTPYDTTFVTVAALFPKAEADEAFRASGPDGEPPVPANWYANRPRIVDVRVEREEQVDGTWTNLTELVPIPGQVSVREVVASETKRARDETLVFLDQPGVMDELLRPPFLPTRNDDWSAPDPRLVTLDPAEMRELNDDERRAREIQNKIQRLVSDRDQRYERYKRLGGNMDPDDTGEDDGRGAPGDAEGDQASRPPRQPGTSGGSGSGGGDRRRGTKRAPPGAGAGGGGPGFGTGGAGTSGTQRTEQAALEGLERRIQLLNRRIARERARLSAMNVAVVVAEPAEDPDNVVVWAHDMSVEAGKVYRYRMTVDMYNPFFKRQIDLVDAQTDLARSMRVSSAPSAWSDELEVLAPIKLFITRATNSPRSPGDLALGTATAEVYRFYYGRWWVESFRVQPGDRVGGKEPVVRGASEERLVDFSTDWFVLDVQQDIDAPREDEDRGLGAWVELQRLSGGDTIRLDPRVAVEDPDRERLREAVEEAELPEEFALGDVPERGG